MAIENSIDRLTRAIEAGHTEAQTETGQTQSERDLAAQEGMWLWAKVAAAVAALMALLTFIGIILIWRTLEHTRRAADYAGDMADQARLATEAAIAASDAGREANSIALQGQKVQLRAYVDIASADIAVEDEGEDGGFRTVIGLKIKNFGASPALGMQWSISGAYFPYPLTVDLQKHPQLGLGGSGDMPPTGEADQVLDFTLAKSALENVLAGEYALYCYGHITYRDIFGEEYDVPYCLFAMGNDIPTNRMRQYIEPAKQQDRA
ncbi:MAG: hypothetical protein ACK4K7_10475 [Allosphingosinicella sp.]|uniref:hypothetical protein n=1 Tax=Allosphingosinicella sp. TaxID=2823234 RepID=UPI0039538616